jgi:hypothetical protein
MKKFLTLSNTLLSIWTLVCYTLLIFADQIFPGPVDAVTVGLLLFNSFIGTFFLHTNYMEVQMHNQHELNRSLVRNMIEIIEAQNTLLLDVNRKVSHQSIDLHTLSADIKRVENQTKPKSSTPRKKKEA